MAGEVVSCHMPGSSGEQRARLVRRGRRRTMLLPQISWVPLHRVLPASLPDREITSVVMEFGCYSLTTVLDSMLSRHEAAIAGSGRFDGLTSEADDWRELVWEAAADVLRLGFDPWRTTNFVFPEA